MTADLGAQLERLKARPVATTSDGHFIADCHPPVVAALADVAAAAKWMRNVPHDLREEWRIASGTFDEALDRLGRVLAGEEEA